MSHERPIPLRAWAERVLLGDAVADKLWSPPAWVDDRPGAAMDAPSAPGRPAGLSLAQTESLPLPSPETLADPREMPAEDEAHAQAAQ